MNILNTVESIRSKAKQAGNYRRVSSECGVGYEWLAKFAVGAIKNPTVENVAKLEKHFTGSDNDQISL